MLSFLLFSLLLDIARAHSLVFCVNWDGQTKGCAPDAYPYHESVGDRFVYYHEKKGPICQAAGSGEQSSKDMDTADTKSAAPLSVTAGQEVTLVWPANNHSPINGDKQAAANLRVFLWHSYETDPDDDLFSTTPMMEFYYGNCYKGGNFDPIGSGSFSDPYCTGTFTIPKEWKTGVHTLVWGWKMLYSISRWGNGTFANDPWNQNEWDSKDDQGPHINYATCFQYSVINEDGGSIKPNRNKPALDFHPQLYGIDEMDKDFMQAGGQRRPVSKGAATGVLLRASDSGGVSLLPSALVICCFVGVLRTLLGSSV